MPMTTQAALLYRRHKDKAEKLYTNIAEEQVKRHHIDRVARLANHHQHAATAIYNCPTSWETSETDRKLIEIRAYLGQPLYDEWRAAADEEDFEQYVDAQYQKTTHHREDAERDADWQAQTEALRHGG